MGYPFCSDRLLHMAFVEFIIDSNSNKTIIFIILLDINSMLDKMTSISFIITLMHWYIISRLYSRAIPLQSTCIAMNGLFPNILFGLYKSFLLSEIHITNLQSGLIHQASL